MMIWEIVLLGVALSMDAMAIGMASGMTEPHMGRGKMLAIALTFGFFQFLMPLPGYYCGAAFSDIVGRIAPWLSCALLALLGGKMIFDGIGELRGRAGYLRPMLSPRTKATAAGFAARLLGQGIATSLDALAVGVTLLAAEVSEGLPLPVFGCAAVIGVVTFAISLAGVLVGRRAGAFADAAGLFGGGVLIAIGIKLLLEGLL